MCDVFGEDGRDNGEEFRVRFEALRGYWERGRRADCELACGRFGREEREKGLGRIERVFVYKLDRSDTS